MYVCIAAVEKAVLLASESLLAGGSILRKGTIQQTVAKQQTGTADAKEGPVAASAIDVRSSLSRIC